MWTVRLISDHGTTEIKNVRRIDDDGLTITAYINEHVSTSYDHPGIKHIDVFWTKEH